MNESIIEKLGISPEWTPSEASCVDKGILANVNGHGLENLLIADIEGYFIFQKKSDRDLCLAAPEMFEAIINLKKDCYGTGVDAFPDIVELLESHLLIFTDLIEKIAGKPWKEIQELIK